MFNNKQEVNTIDERVLPSTGLITIKKLIEYTGNTLPTSKNIDFVITECKKHNIQIFKLSVNNWTWLVCLDDFRYMSQEL